MKRNLFWKAVLVLIVIVWSVWEQTPWKGEPLIDVFEARASNKDETFGEIVSVAQKLAEENPAREFGNLSAAIDEQSITNYFPDISIDPTDRTPTRTILSRLQREASGKVRLGLDLQGGTSFLVRMDLSKIEEQDRQTSVLSQGIEVLRRRLDRFGVAEPVIAPEGDDRIRIDMPGLAESDRLNVMETIERAAFLEFRLVHEESASFLAQDITVLPGAELMEMVEEDRDGQKVMRRYLVKKKAEEGLTGKFVTRAYAVPDMMGRLEVHMEFNSEGADKFGKITQNNSGRQLAIVLDGELYSAPNINEPIMNGRARITGDYSYEEAFGLANVLENPLEAPVEIIKEQGVDPSLGADSIRSGVSAIFYGIIAVAIFMLFYYLMAGLVANVALTLNMIILLGVFCSLDATLTLPGLAGVVLTAGMAVDANVLIFERIREELKNGKSIKGALGAGYDKAFSTIFDANITTLIASVILIYMGSGPVKGFGVTLSIGVLASMFTALFVTRIIFDWMLNNNLLKSLKMCSFVKDTRIDFLNWSKPAFIVSWALVLVGTLYGVSKGSDILGVDFKGGDSATYTFTQKLEAEQIRPAIAEVAGGDAVIRYQRDIGSGNETLNITTAFETGLKVEEALLAAFPEAGLNRVALDAQGATVSAEILRAAIIALLLAMFGILIYVAFRYEFSFAIGAVVAVLHDVLMTFGWFCLSGREFSAPMVAAVLTIVGFSINDTIVIFDRIREYLKLGKSGSFRDIMNYALNHTLARTLITSGTLLIATVALYIFGGGVINDFAFTLIVGVITGTYSSIYIAGSLVLWWHKGQKPKLATTTQVSLGAEGEPATL